MLRHRAALAGAVLAALSGLVSARGGVAGGVALVEVNGVPLAVTERALQADAERAARSLHARWRRESPAVWIGWQRAGERHIVSRQRGALHETASIRPAVEGGGSRVVISVLDTRTPPQRLPPAPVMLPPESRWLSSTRELGAAPEATIEWLAHTARPPAAARRAWHTTLHRDGWREPDKGALSGGFYVRDGQTILLHLQPVGRGTSVVLQLRRTSAP